jgi:hypothetical protein
LKTTWQNCKTGAILCLENAENLLEDAVFLYTNEKYVSAASLAMRALLPNKEWRQ